MAETRREGELKDLRSKLVSREERVAVLGGQVREDDEEKRKEGRKEGRREGSKEGTKEGRTEGRKGGTPHCFCVVCLCVCLCVKECGRHTSVTRVPYCTVVRVCASKSVAVQCGV